ncbi:hypothetical protein BLNAU_5285 [Blattamonas nauphoetae]|uniref:Uncharacterized protein n=1 Tax=Blattamonas nauphoetae TaxID=2049346 RepID=A0ABQ9Y7T6_9EUKA|nr:hypothetical protein BLNAU_5285 [Blattamonas nauphoetae]
MESLEVEKNARTQAERLNMQMEEELRTLKEKFSQLDSERNEVLAKVTRLEESRTPSRSFFSRKRKEQPTSTEVNTSPRSPFRSPQTKQETGTHIKIGAAVIEHFKRDEWTVSGNVFTKAQKSYASLVSFDFGEVVARLSLTIGSRPSDNFAVGIISSSLINESLTTYFPLLKGGAAWDLFPSFRGAMQNDVGDSK